MANRKPKQDKDVAAALELYESIADRFDRSIATANLLSIADSKTGLELADNTIPVAAFHLYKDLQKLRDDVDTAFNSVGRAAGRGGE